MIDFLRSIFPVLIGAVIGYFTNYIAIKMLFHPYNEIRIGGHRLPFSPGIIPKNKSRMARAVGSAVSGQLLTADALAESVKESNIKEKIAEKAAEAVYGSDQTIHDLLLHVDGGEHAVENAGSKIASLIVEKLRGTDLQPVTPPQMAADTALLPGLVLLTLSCVTLLLLLRDTRKKRPRR